MKKIIRLLSVSILALWFGTASAQSRPDAPCGSDEICASSFGPDARRLHDAFLSSATTDAQRIKMKEYISKHTVEKSVDWSLAANDYFSWYIQSTGNKAPPPTSTSSNSKENYFYCSTDKTVKDERSISKIQTFITEYEGIYLRVKGQAGGDLSRSDYGGLKIRKFRDKNGDVTFDSIIIANDLARREWIDYTGSNGSADYFVTLILGVKNGRMYALKICAFYFSNYELSFESSEMSFR